MLVGVAFFPSSFPPSRTWAFYIIKRQNCLNICNTVYLHIVSPDIQLHLKFFTMQKQWKSFEIISLVQCRSQNCLVTIDRIKWDFISNAFESFPELIWKIKRNIKSIILYTPSFLLEIRVIIKILKNTWYPINCD